MSRSGKKSARRREDSDRGSRRQTGSHPPQNDAQKTASQRGDKLLNLKEKSALKLAENASQVDVISFVVDLTMHLEGATEWTLTTEFFEALKTAKEPH